jgi:hypothetical protein
MNNILLLITALFLIVIGTAIGQNTGLYPARPVDELTSMNEKELAREAKNVCGVIVLNNDTAKKFQDLGESEDASEFLEYSKKGSEYLQQIGLVVRDRHKGKSPAWFQKMAKASTFDKCDAAYKAGGFRRK